MKKGIVNLLLAVSMLAITLLLCSFSGEGTSCDDEMSTVSIFTYEFTTVPGNNYKVTETTEVTEVTEGDEVTEVVENIFNIIVASEKKADIPFILTEKKTENFDDQSHYFAEIVFFDCDSSLVPNDYDGQNTSEGFIDRAILSVPASANGSEYSCKIKLTYGSEYDEIFTVNITVQDFEEGHIEYETTNLPRLNLRTLSFNTNGGNKISSLLRAQGSTVSLSSIVPAREGYDFDGWYSDKRLTDKVYSIVMLSNMTVYAGWTEEVSDEIYVTDEAADATDEISVLSVPEAWENPFTDVAQSDAFYDAVRYVYENNLMNGTSADCFEPSLTTTRGMIVTVLWRLEGEPVVNYAMSFDDVGDEWYTEAVRWAASSGIVNGYDNGKFGPEDNITREQMTVIMHRYAQFKGLDVSAGENTNILSYDDAFDIGDYAYTAFQWACAESLIDTADGKLYPASDATRAQIASFLHGLISIQ